MLPIFTPVRLLRRLMALVFIYGIFLPRWGVAQELDTTMWVTNGNVNSVVRVGNKIYIGGNFTQVGPNTGGGVPIDAKTGKALNHYPRVNGTLRVIVADGKGGWYLGGEFNSIGGMEIKNLAHLKPDYSLDLEWQPNPVLYNEDDGQNRSEVNTIVLKGDTIYFGGHFDLVNNQARENIASVYSATGKLTDWNPQAKGVVRALASLDSTMYVGGDFFEIDGQKRGKLAAVHLLKGKVNAWNPCPDFPTYLGNSIYKIIATKAAVYVAGTHTGADTYQLKHLVALHPVTGLLTDWKPNSNREVMDIALVGDTLFAAGGFTQIGGKKISSIAAIDIHTGLALDWAPLGSDDSIGLATSLAVLGKTLYLGMMYPYQLGGKSLYRLIGIDIPSATITNWLPKTNYYFIKTLSVAGNIVFAGGDFKSINGVLRKNLASIDALTGQVTEWNPGSEISVKKILADDKYVYINSGNRTVIGGEKRVIAQIDTVSGLVTPWDVNPNNQTWVNANPIWIRALSIAGKTMYIGGCFDQVNGQFRNSLAAIDIPTGQLTPWNPNVKHEAMNGSGNVEDIVISGKQVYIAGSFNSVGGKSRVCIAEINLDSGIVTDWDPGRNITFNPFTASRLSTIKVVENNIYIGGDFTAIGDQPRRYLAALNRTTGKATAWNPSPNGMVQIIAVNGENIYAGGRFTEIAGVKRNRLAAFDVKTGILSYWNPNVDNHSNTQNLLVQSLFIDQDRVFIGISGGVDFAVGGDDYETSYVTVKGQHIGGGFAAVEKSGPYQGNILRGRIYSDDNANCKKDGNEKGLSDFIVKAEPGSYYASTDTSGSFVLGLGTGKYTISQVLPQEMGLLVQQTCPSAPSSYHVTFTSYGKDTTGFDFGNQVTKLPFLKVEVATDRRRRCFRSTTTVKYCNEGYAAASNVQVKVTYPHYVVPLSASTPWTSKRDSLLTFNIGTLAPGACGTITIIDSVICGNEAIRGLTQCVKAVITPKNNLKVPDARWDKSEVELKAACKNNGFVRLTILNPGLGAMADSATYRIFLDAIQVFESQYQLASKDSLTLEVPVNGKTIRLEADLRPYHPDGNRQPSVTLEGCGSAGMVSISKGFVNQMPQDDAPEEVAVSCLEIRDSYDPNDKVASPAGVGQQHLITEKDELEYLIRFQNTGTDVAYNVTVQDTLDEQLDIATLQIGAASHPFTWNVSGQGRPVITWTFNNINLPDSTSNESRSHGYLRFRIGQKANNDLGTIIANLAAITFDFNSPILTNATAHLIGTIPEDNQQALNAQVCGQIPSQAKAGPDVQLDAEPRTALQANIPDKGFGRWRLVSGKGDIREPENPQTLVEGLGIGKNVFEWTIHLCDQSSSSQMTIERVVIPPAPQVVNPAPICPGEAIPSLTATGVNLKWYADANLVHQLAESAAYQPVVSRTDTFFVTQTVEGYQSKAQPIILTIKPQPPAPQADSVGYICGGKVYEPLTATGENLTWYADATLTQVLGKDNHFLPDNPVVGLLYVTQTVDNCRSEASKVLLKAGLADLTDTDVVPNVITPNGDHHNDTFRLPVFQAGTCIGDFQQIRVYNRWGKVVFESTDSEFAWGENWPTPGLYYYELSYSNFTYRGGLSVLY